MALRQVSRAVADFAKHMNATSDRALAEITGLILDDSHAKFRQRGAVCLVLCSLLSALHRSRKTHSATPAEFPNSVGNSTPSAMLWPMPLNFQCESMSLKTQEASSTPLTSQGQPTTQIRQSPASRSQLQFLSLGLKKTSRGTHHFLPTTSGSENASDNQWPQSSQQKNQNPRPHRHFGS